MNKNAAYLKHFKHNFFNRIVSLYPAFVQTNEPFAERRRSYGTVKNNFFLNYSGTIRRTFYFSIGLLLLLSFKGNAQQSVESSPVINKHFYSIEVSGLKSEKEAKQLNNQILKDQRFYACKVDAHSGKITLAAEKGTRIEDIKVYTSGFNLVITSYTEKYTSENLKELMKSK